MPLFIRPFILTIARNRGGKVKNERGRESGKHKREKERERERERGKEEERKERRGGEEEEEEEGKKKAERPVGSSLGAKGRLWNIDAFSPHPLLQSLFSYTVTWCFFPFYLTRRKLNEEGLGN